jgi:hypothetical protein
MTVVFMFLFPIFLNPERQRRPPHVPERQRHLAAARSPQPRRRVPTQTSSGCLRLRRDRQDVDREYHRIQTKLKTILPFSNVIQLSLGLSKRQRQNRETKLKNNGRHLNSGKTHGTILME